MSELYRVRDATDKDVIEVVTIGMEVHKESAFSHMKFNPGKCEALMLDAIAGAHGMWMQVIEYQERVVGMFVAQVVETYFGYDRVAHDLILAVTKEHRGKCFIAIQEITSNYHKWARENGAKRVFLSTSTGIRPQEIAALYETLGFRQIGTIHEA